MSYSVIEAALLAVIRKHADFPAANTSRGDFRIVGHGKERVVVLTFGSMRSREETLQRMIYTWLTNIDLFVPWRGEYLNWLTTIESETQKLVDTIVQWPKLDGTADVLSVSLIVQSPSTQTLELGTYRGERLICEVEELVNPSRAE